MPGRLVTVLMAWMLLLGGCSLGAGEPVASSGALAAVGVPEPEGIVWERRQGDVTLVGTTSRPVGDELALIAGALAEVPDQLLAKAPLRMLVRAPNIGGANLHPATAAFARGPDVYFVDRTFTEESAGTTRLGLARVLSHELAHVAQFDTLNPDYVAAVLDGRLEISDTGDGSLIVRDFAEAVGWRNSSSDPLRPAWSLPDPSGTTPYGATSPDEDMAESVALVVSGLGELLSPARVRWVEEWLGAGASRLGAGKPWVPPGSRQSFFRDPVYDEAEVASRRPRRAEATYFELPVPVEATEALAQRVGSELRGRSLNGRLAAVDDPRLPRYAGEFTRSDGVRYWVELWDFRSATGFRSAPAGPILTYVMMW